MSNRKRKKIIWAIDPYGEVKIQASAAALARSLSLHNDVEVVYIHGNSGNLSFKAEQIKNEFVRFGLSRAEEKLNKILKELKFKPKKKPHILAHESMYVRTDVKTFVSYAKKVNADAVLVSTNARAGFMRQVLGSFSETLVLESTIPTMIVNPKAKIAQRPGTILFPTDFSDLSWKAYQQVVDFAKASNANIRIFHQYWGLRAQKIPSGISYFKNDRWLDGERLLNDDLQKIKITLSKWLAWTKKRNVKCSHEIKFGFRNIADATLALAKKDRFWMIAMASVTGPISATFLGSNARVVARTAECPVWVLYVGT